MTEHLLRAGHRVTGVDSSAAMLAKADARLASFAPRYRSVCADTASMRLGERHRLAIAPYGMVGHLLADEDRLATFRSVYEHLEPGGVFVFDDRPSWLGGSLDGAKLELLRTGRDPVTNMAVRLLSSTVDLVSAPLSIRHDFIDWLAGDRVARREVVRIVFRNISLDDELALLEKAGFCDVTLFADFTEAPFDRAHLSANARLVVSCRRPS